MRDTFNLPGQIYDYSNNLIPTPWGWSKAARRRFRQLGFSEEMLPDNNTLDRMRQLSHRRTAAELASRLELNFPIASAVELKDEASIRDFVRRHPQSIFKQPWSSSGRGVIPCDSSILERMLPMLLGIIRRQGSVMAEQRHDIALDFAVLCHMDSGKCNITGYSVFFNDSNGAYAGNILAPQDILRQRIVDACQSGHFDAIEHALPKALESIIGNDYNGPLGVDMLITKSETPCIVPTIEVNLRNTMGHVARILNQRYVAAGCEGTYRIVKKTSIDATPQIFNGKIVKGTIDLAPPGTDFSFLIDIH